MLVRKCFFIGFFTVLGCVLPFELSVLKRSTPKTLAFAFGSRLHSKTQRSKTLVLGEEVPEWKAPREVEGLAFLKR